MMEKKDKDKLIEIILKNGEIENDLFNYDKKERNSFLDKYDLVSLVNKYEEAKEDLDLSSDLMKAENAQNELIRIEGEIKAKCADALRSEGIDVDSIIAATIDENEKMDQLYKQLQSMGITKELAKDLGINNPKSLTHDGKNITFKIQDTPDNKKKLHENGIEYEVKDGMLIVNGRIEAKEGIIYEDIPAVRKILDENEMEYIKLAQGEYMHSKLKDQLFVPVNWGNALFPITNSSLVRNIEKLAALSVSAFVISPAGAIILFLVLKRNGMYQNINKPKELNPGEMKALKKGMTVFKEDAKGRPKYFYMDNGVVNSVDARNVTLPNIYKGIRLSPAQIDSLRNGELVMLKNEKNERFAIRVDMTRPYGIIEYVKANRNDARLTKRPTRISSPEEKLEWIHQRGIVGIEEIYGKKRLNLERDSFLAKYGLSQYHDMAIEVREKINLHDGDTVSLEKELKKENDSLKAKAGDALVDMTRNKGKKI